MKYRALKSFFGDLGSIRRNQIVIDPESRIGKKTLDELVDKRKLLVRVGDESSDGLDKLTVGKLKELAAKREIDLGSARTKPAILEAIRAHKVEQQP